MEVTAVLVLNYPLGTDGWRVDIFFLSPLARASEDGQCVLIVTR